MLVVISISETNVTHHFNTGLDERLSKDYDAWTRANTLLWHAIDIECGFFTNLSWEISIVLQPGNNSQQLD
jgi:hypothetical protein